jgi:hypothetical protein
MNANIVELGRVSVETKGFGGHSPDNPDTNNTAQP